MNATSEKDSFQPLGYNDLVEQLYGEYKDSITSLDKKIASFIVIAKTYNRKPEKILENLYSGIWTRKQIAFAKLAIRIYEEYERELKKVNAIDFGDMINDAISELEHNSKLYYSTYDHILVDEYQDISSQRYQLIKSLMNKNPSCKLFCVGDDWQGIMSFSGSDLSYIVNFANYFENPETTVLGRNYRSIKSIVDTGTHLIKINADSQIKKEIVAANEKIKKVKIYFHLHNEDYKYKYYQEMAQHCIERIDEYLKSGYAPQDIMILLRILNPKIINNLREYAKQKNIEISEDGMGRGKDVRLMTIHKSKGLQAKVIFILNVVEDLYGFPCELDDPTIFMPAKGSNEKREKHEEERRLFYVALTRAQEDVYVYTLKCSESKFVKEIKRISDVEDIHY